jgi:hypothetical protein
MQTVSVTRTALFSVEFTRAMLIELAVGCKFYTVEAAIKLADQTLAKAGKTMAALDCAKLRTILDKKLTDAPDDQFGHYKTGEMDYDFECLADLDIGKAGANTKRGGASAPRKSSSKLAGAYTVVKKSGVAEKDEGKWAIWQHVWSCTTFEEFFAKAPTKSVTKTDRVISAASEINWAIKSGWIAPAEQAAE